MQTFLSEVAQRLRADHPNGLEHVVVIFNNRRSGLFLRRQLTSESNNPFFLPRIIGIDELISELGGLSIVPNEYLLFELFDIHRHLDETNDRFESFEDFISFGDMMLNDFSEIDLYRVDAQQLFSNLHDIKAIGEWDIESGKLTSFQEKYLAFYRSLYSYYAQLHERLMQQGRAYNGMAYRYVAENIEKLIPVDDTYHYYFVGFNAISACEDTIIRQYLRQGIGTVISDGDAYYFNDPNQEAGHFLRKHHQSQLFPQTEYPDHFTLGNKEITIISCPENVLQCKFAGELLTHQKDEKPNEAIEQTAIVLGDESLLLPMLNALPPQISTANVTMGYPLTATTLHTLAVAIISLQQRRQKQMFYHQDILDVLSNRNLNPILVVDDIYSKLSSKLAEQHIIYATPDEIDQLCQETNCSLSQIRFLFSAEDPTPDAVLDMLLNLIRLLYNTSHGCLKPTEKESLASLLQIIEYLTELQSKYHFISNLKVLLKIYSRLAQRSIIPFYGEPLQGLQILGVLETRNLDFKKVILLSANEGTMPSGKTPNTLIPYNLKTSFGIPTYREKDAVYAYNFYRLLQRADEVHLIYHTESDGMGKGEPSRFLLQIRRELASRYPDNIKLHEQVLSVSSLNNIESRELSYSKEPSVMLQLQKISQRGFSPSALNKYRNCPLKFYYENIMGIKENDSINEDLEQNELGSYIHAVLENIYTPTIGSPLQSEYLSQALENIDPLLAQVLEKQFHHGRSHTGRNHFLESVAKAQISNFLKTEIANLKKGNQISIISLEKELSHSIQVTVNDTPQQVTISGIADRIDLWNDYIRVIDYKSGKVELKDLRVNEPQPDWANVPDKWFQVLVYTWLFHHNSQSDEPHIAGIQPLGHFQFDFLSAQWENSQFLTPAHLESFEAMLQELLSHLLNPDIPFLPNSESKMCDYCPFAETCNRSIS